MPDALCLNENQVVDAVRKHLEADGYDIISFCHTNDHGIDIVAKKRSQDGGLLIEAKGGTSSKQTTRRYGVDFDNKKVEHSVAAAFYKATALYCQYRPIGHVAGMALPDTDQYRACLDAIRPALIEQNIRVFLVSTDHTVSEF